MQVSQERVSLSSNQHLLLAYIADLELEVDRLRKHAQFLQQEAGETGRRIQRADRNAAPPEDSSQPLADIVQATRHFAEVLQDTYEPPGYHPAHDQVVPIAIRPLIRQPVPLPTG